MNNIFKKITMAIKAFSFNKVLWKWFSIDALKIQEQIKNKNAKIAKNLRIASLISKFTGS